MGLMHKLLKHRDIERQNLVMDTTTTNNALSINNEDISDVDLLPKFPGEGQQFTTEQIIQLCQFLAEKSKRNKTTKMCPAKSPVKSKQLIEKQLDPFRAEINVFRHKDVQDCQQKNMKVFAFHAPSNKMQVLTNKFAGNSDSVDKLRSSNSTGKSLFKNTQHKRDILLKIRHQIYERKRQRQKKKEQLDVWRPW